jgi:hypothetical protein
MMRCCCKPKGEVICTSQCATGGKAYFYPSNKTFTIQANPGLPITPGSQVRIYSWSQIPNTSLIGMTLLTSVNLGSSFSVGFSIFSQWISVFARNSLQGNNYDGCCFNVSGGNISILGFS